MTVKGLDVASFQSSTYDTTGLAFVMVKATEGTTYVNPKMAAQAAHGRAAGLTVGFYHFLHPGNPAGQAAYFVARAASQAGDILVCDWEPTKSGLASNADKDAFIREVTRLRPDHRVILYCDVSRWTGVDKTSYAGDGLWIADPSHPAGAPGIEAPWVMHQYSSAGGVDHNVGNFVSAGALKAWAAGTGTPVPPKVPTTTTPKETNVQLVDLPPIGDIGTTDPKTPSGRKEYGAGYYLAHLLDESRKQTEHLAAIAAALAPKAGVEPTA